jgi:hypothetical protein
VVAIRKEAAGNEGVCMRERAAGEWLAVAAVAFRLVQGPDFFLYALRGERDTPFQK